MPTKARSGGARYKAHPAQPHRWQDSFPGYRVCTRCGVGERVPLPLGWEFPPEEPPQLFNLEPEEDTQSDE